MCLVLLLGGQLFAADVRWDRAVVLVEQSLDVPEMDPAAADRARTRRIMDMEQALCVAAALFGESRGEGSAGMRAVAHVAVQRARISGRTECEVVHARRQFIGIAQATPARIRRNLVLFASAIEIAHLAVVEGSFRPCESGASTHFRRSGHDKSWHAGMEFQCTVGRHDFFVERGWKYRP